MSLAGYLQDTARMKAVAVNADDIVAAAAQSAQAAKLKATAEYGATLSMGSDGMQSTVAWNCFVFAE